MCGAFFVDSSALLVAASQGETATELLVYSQGQYGSPAQKLSQARAAPLPAGAPAAEGGAGVTAGGRQTSGGGSSEAGVERMVVRDWVVGAQVSERGLTHHASAVGEGPGPRSGVLGGWLPPLPPLLSCCLASQLCCYHCCRAGDTAHPLILLSFAVWLTCCHSSC